MAVTNSNPKTKHVPISNKIVFKSKTLTPPKAPLSTPFAAASSEEMIYLTTTQDPESLLSTYQGRVVGTIPSRPATTVLEFTRSIVDQYRDTQGLGQPRRGSMPLPAPKQGPKEIIEPPPDPIIMPLAQEKGAKKSIRKGTSPVTTILSILKSSDVHRGRGTSVDWDTVVKKLHESIHDQEIQSVLTEYHRQPSTPRLFEEQDVIPTEKRLIMTGERVKKALQDTKRPLIKVSSPRHPNYAHLHSVKPRLNTAFTETTNPATRTRLIGFKERALIESMDAQPISTMLKVSSQYEFNQKQLAEFQKAQITVTRAKVNGALSAMISKDRRNARFPPFKNPVGYPNVPQQKPWPYA